MPQLEIEFRGLIGMVSDRTTSTPSNIQVLFPNCTQPSATWIPEVLRFTQPHHPRLFVLEGGTHSSSQVQTAPLNRCNGENVQTLPGVKLEDLHVTINDGPVSDPLVADRGKTGNPNLPGTNVTSCNYIANMEDLVGNGMANPTLGGVSSELLLDDYSGTPQRLISRMVLTTGDLKVGGIWREKSAYVLVRFIPHPVPGLYTPYAAYLAESLVLKADLEATTATFGLRSLDDASATASNLVLEADPTSNHIRLIVENTAISACNVYDPHFLGHYLLRDGWDDLHDQPGREEKVRLPDVVGISDGAGDNAQCSPVDHQG